MSRRNIYAAIYTPMPIICLEMSRKETPARVFGGCVLLKPVCGRATCSCSAWCLACSLVAVKGCWVASPDPERDYSLDSHAFFSPLTPSPIAIRTPPGSTSPMSQPMISTPWGLWFVDFNCFRSGPLTVSTNLKQNEVSSVCAEPAKGVKREELKLQSEFIKLILPSD